MTVKIEGFNRLEAILAITTEDAVFVGLTGNDGITTQYYVLDPLTSNLLYVEGDCSELSKEIRHCKRILSTDLGNN